AVREQALHAQPGAGAVGAGGELSVRSNMARPQFEAMVERAREYIRAGDVFQVVLSQRFEFEAAAPPLAYYRALRETNPSPYMYYLRLSDLHIAGSSPEVLVGLTGRRVLTRPLAGTRPRGATEEEDLALARELRADPKEQAEHVMLVDLGRNDLGRVCEGGSVRVSDVMEIERHSRVMHLVSSVEGWLREDCDAVDVFRATFPAGTVSGAPKIRAMQVIDELEPQRRGVYAGAIGYFSYLGDMDLCIAIRTMVLHRGRGHIQAGAGVVADSVAAREYEETLNKANALLRAARLARER
ncbi:MAG: anthranilate synthase component I family protein, partial [Phycisphaerae bacterium]|nr:anthranilate synthase component I family protein [Phycisphaerae bacterium]